MASDSSWTPLHDAAGLLRLCLDDTPGAEENLDHRAEPGLILGDFELLSLLGRGGMGSVWRAWQRSLRREVAVKVLSSELAAEPGFVASFQREAELAASLRHPAIVPVYAVGEHEGVWFYAMELVDGVTLADVLKERGTLPAREAAQRVLSAAEGMAHAHSRGVWHRDLKPSNLLIEPGGAARVTDFGLARVASAGPTGTTLTALGTPSYIAPEQARQHTASAAVDVYGLGAVLYHALTGRPPFTGSSALEVLEQVTKILPITPRRLNPSVPPDLETLCLRCLEKEPGRRYPSATELAEDLRAFLDGRPVKARPISWLGHVTRWVKREPVSAALAATATTAALATIWLLHTSHRLDQATHVLEQTQHEAEFERQLSVLQNAAAYLHDGNVRQAGDILNSVQPRALQTWGFPAHYLTDQCTALQSQHVEPEAHQLKVWKVEASPDGRKVATSSEDGFVTVWDTATRQRHKTTRFPEETSLPWSLSWEDNDRLLVTSTSGQVRVFDATLAQWSPPFEELQGLREWQPSADRRWAVGVETLGHFWLAPQVVKLVELATHTVRWTAPLPALKAALSPDGRYAVLLPDARQTAGSSTTPMQWLSVWDWQNNTEVARLSYAEAARGEPGRCVAWSPDGQRIVAGVGETLLKWDLPEHWPTPASPLLPTAQLRAQGGLWQARFVEGGRYVLTASSDQQVRVIDALRFLIHSKRRGHHNEVWSVDLAQPASDYDVPAQIISGDKDGGLRWWSWPPEFEPEWFPYEANAAPFFDSGHLLFLPPRTPARTDFASWVDLRTGERAMFSHSGLIYGWDPGRNAALMVDWAAAQLIWVEPRTNRRVHELPLLEGPTLMQATVHGLSPDGTLCWEWSPQRLSLRRSEDGAVVHEIRDGSALPATVSLSADNRWLVVSFRNETHARVVDLHQGATLTLPHKYDAVVCVAHSPDSHYVATGGEDGQIRLWRWDAASQAAVYLETILPGILESPSALAFTPDGRYLVSAESKGILRFWHLDSRREAVVLRGAPGCQFLTFSPDGTWLATTTGQRGVSGVRLLHAPPP